MYIYIYMIFTMKKQTTYLKMYFDFMSLSIHPLFTIQTATKITPYNQSVIIIVGN